MIKNFLPLKRTKTHLQKIIFHPEFENLYWSRMIVAVMQAFHVQWVRTASLCIGRVEEMLSHEVNKKHSLGKSLPSISHLCPVDGHGNSMIIKVLSNQRIVVRLYRRCLVSTHRSCISEIVLSVPDPMINSVSSFLLSQLHRWT